MVGALLCLWQVRLEQTMNTKLFIGLYIIVFFIGVLAGLTLGLKAGREQVYLKEVECVDHPLKEHKVLCKKVREVQELEIEWIL